MSSNRALEVYSGSDGEATKRLYADLEKKGPIGQVAVNLFRAQKCSSRAKVYRGGGYRDAAYDRKGWSIKQLTEILNAHGAGLGISFGWGRDEGQYINSHVLYVDLPEGQVSFHSPERYVGPAYPGEWDGLRMSAERIVRFTQRVLDTEGRMSTTELPAITEAELAAIRARGWEFLEGKNGWIGANRRLNQVTIAAERIEDAAERALNLEWAIEQGHIRAPEPVHPNGNAAQSAATESDPLDLVPEDRKGRTWRELTDHTLEIHRKSFQNALDNNEGDEKTGPRLDRIMDELRRRKATWEAESQQPPEESIDIEAQSDGPFVGDVETATSDPETVTARSEAVEEQDHATQLAFNFDYSQIEDEAARVIAKSAAQEIRDLIGSIKRDSLTIGRRLGEVKAELKRGTWVDWLDKETGMSRDAADRLIAAARYADEFPHRAENLDRFERSAVYMLVAPSTPESARVEMHARAEAGEKITKGTATEIIEAHKPEKAEAPDTIPERHQDSAGEPASPSEDIPRTILETPTNVGLCRVCGCTWTSPCATENDEGEPIACSWTDKTETLCTSCASLMENRGLSEETLRERIGAEGRPVRDVARADPAAEPEASGAASRPEPKAQTRSSTTKPSEPAPAKSPENGRQAAIEKAWHESLIRINLLLFRAPANSIEDPGVRRVQIAVSVDEDSPTFTYGNFNCDADAGILRMFDAVAARMAELKAALPQKPMHSNPLKPASPATGSSLKKAPARKAAAKKAAKRPAPAPRTAAKKPKAKTAAKKGKK